MRLPTFIFAVNALPSSPLKSSFMPRNDDIAFTKPMYSMYWMKVSKTMSCPNVNVWMDPFAHVISLWYGSSIGMSTQRTSPNVSKTLRTMNSFGRSRSFSLRFANHRHGSSFMWTVSGRSPNFISFMPFASLKYESQSWRVGKSTFDSAARTFSVSVNPLSLIVFVSSWVMCVRSLLRFSTSPSNRTNSIVLFTTCNKPMRQYWLLVHCFVTV